MKVKHYLTLNKITKSYVYLQKNQNDKDQLMPALEKDCNTVAFYFMYKNIYYFNLKENYLILVNLQTVSLERRIIFKLENFSE